MTANTKIQWCDHTFNPWVGCAKVSPGCDHCYAEGWAKRSGMVKWGNEARRRTSLSNWQQPLKWDKQARDAGVRAKVFCASLADVFDNTVPKEWRFDLFSLIAVTPNLDWLLLTKRIGNANGMLMGVAHLEFPWPNIWIGATVVNQEEADRDIPKLLATPAAVRFLSIEPMLEQIDLSCTPYPENNPSRDSSHAHGIDPLRYQNGPTIHWVIVGGESGHSARPMQIEWARSIAQQCKAARVPFFMKQLGGSVDKRGQLNDFPDDLRVREFPSLIGAP